ncbi:hypothetical protein [Granulicella sibirica]|uniref:hypothetical protein n=1 Tax=Granulicella sibirica TaxID=2479048 RepID=UPI001009278B|nr:hypothetical protein [Granulicella sibirica]
MAEIRKDLVQSLTEPMIKVFKAGGFGLTFLTLGAILMLTAYNSDMRGGMSNWVFGTGFLLIVLTSFLFFMKDIVPLLKAYAEVRRNARLIKTVQDTAIELSGIAFDLQTLAYGHATAIAKALGTARAALESIPWLGPSIAGQQWLQEADSLSASIIEIAVGARATIKDIEKALVAIDPKLLERYLDQLRTFHQEVEQALRSPRSEQLKRSSPGLALE